MHASSANPVGPLTGLRVVEVASEHAAYAGKLMADLGAEVIVVEPPGGHYTRGFEPFADDQPGVERSLWWWTYNTSKKSVVLAPDDARFDELVDTADIVLEGNFVPDAAHRARNPQLIWVSVTAFGRAEGGQAQFTDMTVLAGGPMWSCGYDDHDIPPVRGGGNQGYQTAGLFAVMATLTAYLARSAHGIGQLVDVNMHACANVTTEAASYDWHVARREVQRMTGRHAGVNLSTSSIAPAADGRRVHTGVPPRSPKEFRALLDWLDKERLRDQYGESFFLEMGIERGGVSISELRVDAEATAIFNAGREAMRFLADRLSAYDFFLGAQSHGLAAGIVYSPEEVIEDPHFVARGFPVELHHDEIGRTAVHLGLPFVCQAAPGGVTRAPHLGEHDDEILGSLP